MNLPALAPVLQLRYRLLWAQVRSRNGKITLFLVGYLLAATLIVLLALGGIGAALASVRLGKAQLVAEAVLAAFYLNATSASVLLGIGMNAAFTDAALRRYPLTAAERLAVRQLTAFLEPTWLFVLALDVGLAAGFSVLGIAPPWLTLPGALLLVVTNYLLARVIAGTVERILATRAGPLLMLIVVIAVTMAPAFLAPPFLERQAWRDAAAAVLRFTPPAAAAAMMALPPGLPALYGFTVLLAWMLVLVAALVLIEWLPAPSRSLPGAPAAWDGPSDRIAALFGPAWAPLIAKTLRYYSRSNRVRYNYLLAIPVLIVLVISQSRQGGPSMVFLSTLCTISVVGFLCTAAMSVNAFGYDGGGFRRYFVLPIDPARALRAASLVALLLGAALIPVAILVWLLLAPVPTDGRMLVMLLASAFGGLFLFHGLCIWTSLLAPRRASFTSTFGNNLSTGGNIVLIGGVMGAATLPPILLHYPGIGTVLRFWWVLPLLTVAAGLFYLATLRAGAAVFIARRERLLAVVEGRG